jgi:hypothetical protein
MSTLTSLMLSGCLALSLAACSSGPPKPVLPDGLHRMPVNHVPPAPDVPAAPDLPVSPDAGDGS